MILPTWPPEASHLPVRILPELRSAHIQDFREGPPVQIIYLDEKYDLDPAAVPREFRRLTVLRAAAWLLRSPAEVLEVPEPLWIRFLPKNLLLIAAWRTGGLFRRTPRTVVTYAIENNDLASIVFGHHAVPRVVAAAVRLLLGAIVSASVDVIAFGSAGAQQLYRSLPFSARLRSNLFSHLPRAAPGAPHTPVPLSVVFLGRLEKRKGILTLLDAWEKVTDCLPGACIRIIGAGPLEDSVRSWASTDPSRREVLGAVPHRDVPALLGDRTALVAPSERDGRWREQIGLPILEGLSQGLTVITTEETGNAEWLRAHGHRIVAPKNAHALADALTDVLRSPLDRTEVLAALPRSRGRIDAAEWLLHLSDLPEKVRDER